MATASLPRLHRVAPFHIGTVAKWPDITEDTIYARRALEQFSSLTPERLFKAAFIHPSEDTFNWNETDRFVSFCEEKGKRLHGHTLVWDRELPAWMAEHGPDEELLRHHISTIVSRYRRRIQAWDVVNEAFNEEGLLREGPWHGISGPDYIEEAFRSAAAADPQALLFYNDFDLEVNPVKRRSVLDYLNRLRDKGVKVDGIGLQLHLNISTARPAEIAAAFMEIAASGYLLHLSELDISVNPYEGIVSGKEELFSEQASLLMKIMAHYLDVPPALKHGVTFWGVGDADSWLILDLKQVDYPLLLDEQYAPKPSFYSLVKLFEHGH
jgi:endo-1,4-beta-xylanase